MKGKKGLLVILAVVLAAAVFFSIASPVAAAGNGNNEKKTYLELDYYPLKIGDGGGYDANIRGFRAKGELDLYNGLWAGIQYTYGTADSIKMKGYIYNSAKYEDWEFYFRVPTNLPAMTNAISYGAELPAPSPLSVLLLYKTHSLKSNDQAGDIGWENATGAGLGLGYEGGLGGAGKTLLYAQVGWFPGMSIQTSSTALKGTDSMYKGLTYRIGFKFPLNDYVLFNLGYNGESHTYQTTTLQYSAVVAGLGVRF